ncbi:MAG: hypothetical protein LC794_04605 [Acidobacteria bacterium]|nr:hypothetical protein [Acidobacteriota bacterium]
MSQRERLRELALTVNEGLTAYIAVHNEIFEEAATAKSLLKNLAGKGVLMSKLLEDCEALVPLWDDISEELEDFKSSDYLLLSEDERGFFDILSRYVEALQKTVTALVDRQRLMNEGAKGGRNNPMTWTAHREKEDLYQQAVNEYIAVGEKLNEARYVVFGEHSETTVSLDAQCASAFTIISRTVRDDAHWRAFGFKKCPHRGKIFQGLVPAAKLERETTLLRELCGASFGAICRWTVEQDQFPHREVFIAKLIEYVIDGVAEPLWPVFRFVTRRDAIDFIQKACADYVQTDDRDRPQVFLNRCAEHMGQLVPKAWIVGAAWLFSHPKSYVFNTALSLTDAGIASNYENDIELNDHEFLTIVENML